MQLNSDCVIVLVWMLQWLTAYIRVPTDHSVESARIDARTCYIRALLSGGVRRITRSLDEWCPIISGSLKPHVHDWAELSTFQTYTTVLVPVFLTHCWAWEGERQAIINHCPRGNLCHQYVCLMRQSIFWKSMFSIIIIMLISLSTFYDKKLFKMKLRHAS